MGPAMRLVRFVCALLVVARGAAAFRVSVFGSSVANGRISELECPLSPDPPNDVECAYAEQLRQFQLARGNTVVNVSVSGDTTTRLLDRFDRDLVPTNPDIVFIGLSLGNEGLIANPKEAFESYIPGMQKLIQRMRDLGYLVLVGGCYAHQQMFPEAYEITKLTNALLNKADVPSVNFLGAVDNGRGQWFPDFYADDLHPNGLGHLEMYRTIVPTVFDAIMAGKPTPVRASGDQFVAINDDDGLRISFEPEDVEIHAFTISITARVCESSIGVHTLLSIDFPDSSNFPNEIQVHENRIVYRAQNGSGTNIFKAPTHLIQGQWYTISLTHYWARQAIRICVSDLNFDAPAERQLCTFEESPANTPTSFTLGSSNPSTGALPIDVQDLLIYRSSLNEDELVDLHSGELLQSSLEVYAPLDAINPTENRAQSLSELTVTRA